MEIGPESPLCSLNTLRTIDMRCSESMDMFSTEYSRAGGCANFSHPKSSGDVKLTSHDCVQFNLSGNNRSSTRFALLQLKHEEERAIQQRIWEAERRALKQEKRLLHEKYSLLEKQILERAKINKRWQDATEAVVVENQSDFERNESSTDSDEPSIDDQAAEAADDPAQHHNTIVPAEQSRQALLPVTVGHPADRIQIVGIQQHITSAFPSTITNGHKVVIYNNTSSEHNAIITVSTLMPLDQSVKTKTNSVFSTFECSLAKVQNNIIQIASLLLVSKRHKGKLAPRTSVSECVSLRAPPKFLASNAPDPAPPPLRLYARRTRSHYLPSLTDRSDQTRRLIVNSEMSHKFSTTRLILESRVKMDRRRCNNNVYRTLDGDTVGVNSDATKNRKGTPVTELYYGRGNIHVRCCSRSMNYSSGGRMSEFESSSLCHETAHHEPHPYVWWVREKDRFSPNNNEWKRRDQQVKLYNSSITRLSMLGLEQMDNVSLLSIDVGLAVMPSPAVFDCAAFGMSRKHDLINQYSDRTQQHAVVGLSSIFVDFLNQPIPLLIGLSDDHGIFRSRYDGNCRGDHADIILDRMEVNEAGINEQQQSYEQHQLDQQSPFGDRFFQDVRFGNNYYSRRYNMNSFREVEITKKLFVANGIVV